MKSSRLYLLILTLLLVSASCLFGQSGQSYRKTGIMNGNQVRTVFGNWGVIGQPATAGRRGAWRNDNDGYLGDVSLFVGGEIKSNSKTVHSVVTCPVARPTKLTDTSPSGKYWTFEPMNGYANPNGQKVAISNDPVSWPPSWPDKLSDASDPGWKGSWNGYFGKKVSADLETYFVMDDNNDERFNFSANNGFGISFKPDSTRPDRNGLGLDVRVRALQWSQFLAKDNIFWLYEISNTGTTTYDRAVFGMLVGTYIGVTSTEDYREYTNDWSFYDITQNITYTGNFPSGSMGNPLWVGGVGLVGYAFLESPGNPYDGIDNDGDADSSGAGRSAPQFTSADFDTVTLMPNQQIVLINDDFSRHLFTIPNVDSVQVYTRGLTTMIYPGRTRVVEGNVVRDPLLGDVVNRNAYDGIDNNFNGLIDENYFLHYHQIKKDQKGNTLIDILRPVRHMNYITGQGVNSLSMIDERRDDGMDNNLNWNVTYDDVGRDGLAGTHDFGEGDGIATSGYDANGYDTGLPGEPHIDKTDVKESDQIGLTSFFYFVPAGDIDLHDKESLWKDLQPGYFFVPSSIVNNRPQAGEDGDFIYGSGYFPLRARSIERFSLALVYGGGLVVGPHSVNDDIADLLKNKKTVQKIYDANYQFPQPPAKPTLTSATGDREVTLYWDRVAEDWVDPVLLTKTFEGYKIYKSTTPDFTDIRTITDANGVPQGYRPLQQFDLKDGITGVFATPPQLLQDISGFSYYLGDDTGLEHSFVDTDVENGRRYYYAVVAYSKGDPATGVLPAENNFPVSISPTGEVSHDINVAVVTPNPKVAGYITPASGVSLGHTAGPATGTAAYQVLDPAVVTGHQYRVEFLDTKVDGIDNNGNGIADAGDSTEWDRRTTFYSVLDLSTYKEQMSIVDTLPVQLQHGNIADYTVTNSSNAVVPPEQYKLNKKLGSFTATPALPQGTYTIEYRYYPVYMSPNMQGSPFAAETKDADNFDGVRLSFSNYWSVVLDSTRSGWAAGKVGYRYAMAPLDLDLSTGQAVYGYRHAADYQIVFANTIVDTGLAADYQIVFANTIVDTGLADDNLFVPATPTNFRVYNETDHLYEEFLFFDADGNGVVSASDEIVILQQNPRGTLSYSWDIAFSSDKPGTVITFGTGDTLNLRTTKPYRQGDVYQFTTEVPRVEPQVASNDLSRVKAVPNPYVAAAAFEAPLPPGITSGRGERKIEFIHVPQNATVKIFTARGEHIITLTQSGNLEDGTVVWNLKSKENLDIAYGVYFYVVESTQGTKTGKLAIIK
jgi:hypothetical protein